jgi:CheY-like chemotaxis protein
MAVKLQKRALIVVDQSDRNLRLVASLKRKDRCAIAARIDPTAELKMLSAQVLSRLLTDDGFEVEVVAGARAALRRLTKQWPPSALIIDIARPGPRPAALARYVRSLYPWLPIVFVTSEERMFGESGFEEPYAVLEKPIDYSALAEILDEFLESQRYCIAALDSSPEAATQP